MKLSDLGPIFTPARVSHGAFSLNTKISGLLLVGSVAVPSCAGSRPFLCSEQSRAWLGLLRDMAPLIGVGGLLLSLTFSAGWRRLVGCGTIELSRCEVLETHHSDSVGSYPRSCAVLYSSPRSGPSLRPCLAGRSPVGLVECVVRGRRWLSVADMSMSESNLADASGG